MSTPSENFETANEADVVEQMQDLDGGGSVSDGPAVAPGEANEADALEQGAELGTDDDDAYPRAEDRDA